MRNNLKRQGEEMINSNYERNGAYIVEIVPVKKIKDINLLPVKIKNIIVSDSNEIFKKNQYGTEAIN